MGPHVREREEKCKTDTVGPFFEQSCAWHKVPMHRNPVKSHPKEYVAPRSSNRSENPIWNQTNPDLLIANKEHTTIKGHSLQCDYSHHHIETHNDVELADTIFYSSVPWCYKSTSMNLCTYDDLSGLLG